MNILFFAFFRILPERGGVQRVSELLADEFERRGNKCFYLARYSKKNEIYSVRQYFLPHDKLHGKFLRENEKFFERFLEENKISHIIWQDAAYRSFPFCRVLKKIKQRRNIFLVSVLHNCPDHWRDKFQHQDAEPSFFEKIRTALKIQRHYSRYKKYYRSNYDASDAVVLLSSNYDKEMLKYLGKNRGAKLTAIQNPRTYGAMLTDFSRKRKELLFVGRMVFEQKRPDYLLKIWGRLQKQFQEWSLRFVGDGDYLPELKRLAGELGIERVSFEGFCNPAPFYRDASIFCMTSVQEGFGMVLVEAASFGCVPVAFESYAAVRDIIDDGENGALVPAFDVDAYAETLARLMRDDALRERLARNALAQIPSKFSPQKIGDMWDALFNEISGNKNR
ncbi:MAG: glycosyltransferase [Candidatus Spyradosoma sp.]